MRTLLLDVFLSLLVIVPPLVMLGLSLRLLFDYEDFNFDWLYRKLFPTGRKASPFSFSIAGLMLAVSLVWIVIFFRSNVAEYMAPYLSSARPALEETVAEETVQEEAEIREDTVEDLTGSLLETEVLSPALPVPALPGALPVIESTGDAPEPENKDSSNDQ